MLKSLIIGLLLTTPAIAKEPWELDIPSLDDQINAALADKRDAVLEEVRTNDYFAGTLFKFTDHQGQEFIIDRLAQTPKRTPGNPPPRLETLGSLLGGLSTEARGRVRVEVKRQFYQDGTLKSEDWIIDMGGSWQAETGMGEANDKAHK